jgi:hypothetical protein
MTRQEKIAALDAKFAPKFQNKLDNIETATQNLNEDRATYALRLNAINAYYNALEEKQRIDDIIAQGEPGI